MNNLTGTEKTTDVQFSNNDVCTSHTLIDDNKTVVNRTSQIDIITTDSFVNTNSTEITSKHTDSQLTSDEQTDSQIVINECKISQEFADIEEHVRKIRSIPTNEYVDEEMARLIHRTSTTKKKKMQLYLTRKAMRKEKRKLKKEKQKALKAELNVNATQESTYVTLESKASRKFTYMYSMADSSRKFHVILDLSYEKYMNDKGLAKTANQVARCYARNRRCPDPVQLHLCSFSDKIREEISKIDGYKKWDVHFHEKTYLSHFKADQLVYLSSDSHNILEKLDPHKAYIIGGFVDHNSQKGISLSKAKREGIAHARLPLDRNIALKTCPVLAINHVFEIILEVAHGTSWRLAFEKVIPRRKKDEDGYIRVYKKRGSFTDPPDDENPNIFANRKKISQSPSPTDNELEEKESCQKNEENE